MNTHSIGKRSNVILLFLVTVSFVLLLGSGCYAGGDSFFEGSWTGEVKASDGTNSSVVNLTLQQAGKSTLRYEDPRGCTLTVKLLKNDGDKGRVYSLAESTGGFCDKLLLGKLSLRKQENNSLSCEMTSLDDKSSTKISEKGMLRRPGK